MDRTTPPNEAEPKAEHQALPADSDSSETLAPRPAEETIGDLSENRSEQELGADSVIAQRYRLLELIGRGAAGVVFRAEHLELGIEVAIKMLNPEYGNDKGKVERFRREARAAGRIGHPNIIRVTDLGRTEDGRLFYVMDLVRGENLAEVVARVGHLPPKQAVELMAQVCDALQAAHNQAVIHRDLKPENIVIEKGHHGRDTTKIVDFGLSYNLNSNENRITQQGQAVGTPYYMAPEQVRGDPPDHRTDVYAAGTILYEMLSGRPPFEYDTVAETLTAHLHEPPTSLTEREPGSSISLKLDHAVLTAIEKGPEDRFQSMAEFASALLDAVPEAQHADPPTPSLPPTTSSSSRPSRPRKSLPYGTGPLGTEPGARLWLPLVIVILLLGGIVGLLWPRLNSAPESARLSASPRNSTEAAALVSPPAEQEHNSGRSKGSSEPRAQADASQASAASGDNGPDAAPDVPARPERGATPSSSGAHPTPPSRSTRTDQESTEPNLLTEAQARLAEHQLDEATVLFRRVLQGAPGTAAAWAGLGQAEFERGDLEAATQHLRRAVALAPRDVGYRLLCAGALLRGNRTTEAAEMYRQVLELRPGHPIAERMLQRFEGSAPAAVQGTTSSEPTSTQQESRGSPQ